MNILIASVYSHESYSRGIMPDVLQRKIEENPEAEIYYLTDSGSFSVCYFNHEKKPEICYRCKTAVKNTLKLIKGNFEHLKISDIITKEDHAQAMAFFGGEETVKIDHVFEGFEVGAATLSTYFSRIRDRNLVELSKHSFVKELAVNALALYLAVKRFLEERKIDVVYNFNGRHEYVRAIMRAAHAVRLDCYNLEKARPGGYIDFYKNTLPHTIKYKQDLVMNCWENSSLPEEEKKKIGAAFYERQKNGETLIFPSFTGNMKKGMIPECLLNSRKNLVVFNSSDDEFASLGEEFQNPFFKDQNEGLEYLVYLAGSRLREYNLIIRMHPNLVGVPYPFVEKIKELHQKHPNVFVIEPESEIDTYALMDRASKVISFGSTTGLEANVRQKPVILLGKCFYYYTGAAYVPARKEEIPELLSEDLSPRPMLPALQFGYYYMQGGTKAKYYYEGKIGSGVYFKDHPIPSYSADQRLKAKMIQYLYKHFNIVLK